ncbi:glutathione-disulfide reductase [Oryzicola mucosus]|uniref:Glutathione reductase n=1 Tax=Oryzicola mucosus TaxID=2767425 RepID=A0A8J6U8U4_9HYPH|nr:glutathione-disulfide reductase [Oryzicola mucosus]MBD0416172.1 glutathione-disulfide reductase [Oryzicola mucosus]
MTQYDYDLFVIGGGSGGVRASRVAAALGKRVAVAEEFRFGGTCVIRGCVPKKLYVYASQFHEQFRDAVGYGWSVPETSFDWKKLVEAKEREITRLEGIYKRNVEASSAIAFDTRATLVDAHTIRLEVDGRLVTADQILIATGGRPSDRPALPGYEHCITSNEAFDLPELPKAIVVEGGGYIAVEFANIFHGLGVTTTLVYRGHEILNRFDMDLRKALHEEMEKKGIRIVCHAVSKQVVKRGDGRLEVHLNTDEVLIADQVMQAVGRRPNTEDLGLEDAGVKLDEATGAILVDDYSQTNVENIWAIGDVTNRVQLTPVAIHEAMCLIETIFKNNPTKPDYDTIPTAVFSQPEIGTVGLSEDDAAHKYPNLEIYRTSFRPMRNILAGRDERMLMKLVVDADTRKVIGAHVLGPDAGEMAQLLGISVKAGLTKDDFDATMAVHPSAAEELVTLYKPTYLVKDGNRIG